MLLYNEFEYTDFLNRILGSDAFGLPDFAIEPFVAEQREKVNAFIEKSKAYYLY